MSFALVLGGGGVVGVAWSIGVLASVSEHLGLDLRDARVTVGTSAGSVVGALIAAGRSLEDQIEVERTTRAAFGSDTDDWGSSFDPQLLVEIFQLWTSGPMSVETARRIGERAVRASKKTDADWVDLLARRLGSIDWPGSDLRIAATNCETGERRIFTASDGVDLARAVSCSSSVPGICPPVYVDGVPYMDGGVWSLTNADVILDAGVTDALLLGPQAGAGFLAGPARASMEHECRLLEEHGIKAHALIPGSEFEAFGANLMDPALRAPAVGLGLTEGVEWAKRLLEDGFEL
ncbi:MAG: patatin-like phospholipase family protein [Actinomycetota bacterium]